MRHLTLGSPSKAVTAGALAAAFLAAWLLYTSMWSRAPWPMYQNNPTHNAIIRTAFPGVHWHLKLGGKVNAGLAFDGTYIYTDDFGGNVVAIDARSGKLAWKRRVGNVVMSTPAISSSTVFAGSGSNHIMWDTRRDTFWGRPEGDRFYAFSRADGTPLWSYPVRGEAMPSPAYAHDRIFFATGDGNAYALDAKTGKVVWIRPLRGISTMASAMVDDNKVFFVASMGKHWRHKFDQNHVVAVNPDTGKIIWVSSFGSGDCAVTIARGTVFVEGTRDVFGRLERVKAHNIVSALDEGTGALKWKYTSAAGIFTNIASTERSIAGMYDGNTYYQSIPATHEFAAFDAYTGKLRWKIPTRATVKMSAVSSDGRLYFGDVGGKFYVVNASTGKVVHIHAFPRYFTTSPPIIAGKTLLVVNDQTVMAIPVSKL